MTIKYVCDDCGAEVYENEAVGEGVIIGGPGNSVMGKVYNYDDPTTGIALTISVHREGSQHFCMACMWRTLEHMMDTFAPKIVEPQTVEPRHLSHVDNLSNVREWHHAYEGGPHLLSQLVKEPDAETDPSLTEPDTQLPQLYAEGVLSETGPDEPADDSLPPNPYIQQPVTNFDDYLDAKVWHDTRPGWQYRSTAAGI